MQTFAAESIAPLVADATVGEKRKELSDASDTGASSVAPAVPHRGGSHAGRGTWSKRGRGEGGRSGGGRNRAESFEQDGADAAFPPPSGPVAPLTPLQQQFSLFSAYLDKRNDMREAVYQMSRDLTRASKKVITQLQRANQITRLPTSTDASLLSPASSASSQRDFVLSSCARELHTLYHMLAKTVEGFKPEDFHRYAGAYSPGFQEFVEAATMLKYLQDGTLLTHAELEHNISSSLGQSSITIPLSDYLIGALDLGGELMRYATNCITTGNRQIVPEICLFLRKVYAEYQQLESSCGHGGPYRELSKKMEVWLQSLQKIETLCYKIHIRGAEGVGDERMLTRMIMAESQAAGGSGVAAMGEREENAGGPDREE